MSGSVATQAFATVASLLPEALLLVSPDGEIHNANPRAGELLERTPAELLGRNVGEFVAEEHERLAGFLRVAARSGTLVPGGYKLKDALGRRLACRLECAVLSPRTDGKPALLLLRVQPKEEASSRFIALNLRIEELAKEVARRQRAEAALRATGEQLAEADRRKDEFLAMLAHELRNPLAVLSNGVQVLRMAQSGGAGERRVELAGMGEAMERQVRHLARMVDDLLDVSRITSGKITLQREPLELEAALRGTLEACRQAMADKGIALSLEVAREPLLVEADPARLAQVFGNLLSNAIKFSNPGGSIRVAAAEEAGQAVVRVQDRGAGIAPEMLGRVFELFAQDDSTLARSRGGLGVGLTIAKLIAELHGGSLEARSEGRGRGAELIVRLPLLRERPENAAQTRSRPAQHEGRRILVVDDNPDAASSLALLLEFSGHAVKVANDGEAALHEAEAWQPEVVLLDVGMPGMDGYEVARRLRERARTREALIIAVTGYGTESDRRRTQAAGFDHHLTKPVERDALEQLMRRKSGAGARA